MNSAIYNGWVSHQRFQPKAHGFRYRLFMLMLDLDELPTLFQQNRLWSYLRPNCAYFKRADYYGNPQQPLTAAIRALVKTQSGLTVEGRIYLLTHLRYWGVCFNPVSFYYCHDGAGQLIAIVSHITNTPWNEDHAYVHVCNLEQDSQVFQFDKKFHVSPFMPMDIAYTWQFSRPAERLHVHMQNWRAGEAQFFATLNMTREAWSAKRLNQLLWQFPWMTAKVIAGIYWQALRLWLKRVPFYAHP